MPEAIESRYDHKSVEDKIYDAWEKSGYFNPDDCVKDGVTAKNAEAYTIIMPPPNANGNLHAGHALFITLQDIMTRFRRMRGYKTLWLPGADHAGFETQIVYEKELEKQGRSRFNMEPQKLYEEILAFTLTNKKNMEAQVRNLGASCDWSREKFTLDPDIVEKVQGTFVKMYEDGLIYRGKRIINWCSKHQTSLSDVETQFKDKTDNFYYMQYGPFVIATARPETKFGDKYVVMHPDDKRYKKYKDGEKISLEWINGPITATVIKDASVDMDFGTGVMTITPWHDAVDFDIAERHHLDKEQIIDMHGKLLPVSGEFAGMKTEEARSKIVEKLKEKGLLVKIDEKYEHAVRVCYKCERPIEPQIMDQWFVKMKPLAELAIKSVNKGEIQFIPERFKQTFLYWMENTIDWNISRQIVWGIPIPAWFCIRCSTPKIQPKIKSRWFVVRHGETDWNKEGRMQGHGDEPLNDTGRAQARMAAEVLRDKNIGLIISSDLSRAQETARIISAATGAEVITDPMLRERHHGDVEGMLREDAIAKYGKLNDYDKKVANGETYREVEERIKKVFADHRKRHSEKNIVIVSHGGTMRMLNKHIRNITPEEALSRPGFPNTHIISFDILEKPCTCGSDLAEKDSDTFDTWFSSGQWPLLTLNYPDGKDFKTFYPTSVMETGYDLIFRWVPRMVIFGLYLAKKIPFRAVYLHGLVNDPHGKKMSKSKGNVVNPLELTEKYGADALRIGLVVGNSPGSDLALSEDKIRGYRNFATKIWNVARFVLISKPDRSAKKVPLTAEDEKNLDEVKKVKAEAAKHIEDFEFHLAAEKIYHYFWHTFADKIIETYKPRLKDNDAAAYQTLEEILLESLKMLHPFMPFVTEEIYQKLKPGKLLMVEKW